MKRPFQATLFIAQLCTGAALADGIQIAPGVRHWHGATASNGMRHIALQEAVDGKNVEWLEQVSDDQYAK